MNPRQRKLAREVLLMPFPFQGAVPFVAWKALNVACAKEYKRMQFFWQDII